MTFELTTLRLGTTHDAPQGAVPLGEPLRDGRHPGVVLVEGGHPPRGGVLRANRPAPLLGLRVPEAAGAGRLRVAVVLQVDPESWRRWEDHDAGISGGTLFGPGTHRLLTISAQGVPRAACLLVPDDSGPTRQRIQFLLGPDEIGSDGLLVLGLEDTLVPPGWVAPLARGAIGAVIARVLVAPVAADFRPTVSTGRPPAAGEQPVTSVPPGYLVVNPGMPGDVAVVRLHTSKPAPARVEAVDTAGRSLVGETVAPGADGAIDVRLGSLDGPVLLRAADPMSRDAPRAYRIGVRTPPTTQGPR